MKQRVTLALDIAPGPTFPSALAPSFLPSFLPQLLRNRHNLLLFLRNRALRVGQQLVDPAGCILEGKEASRQHRLFDNRWSSMAPRSMRTTSKSRGLRPSSVACGSSSSRNVRGAFHGVAPL